MRRRLSIILSAVMLLTALPLYAFADENAAELPAGQECVVSIDGTLRYINANGEPDTFIGWKTIGANPLMDRDKAERKDICLRP